MSCYLGPRHSAASSFGEYFRSATLFVRDLVKELGWEDGFFDGVTSKKYLAATAEVEDENIFGSLAFKLYLHEHRRGQ